MENPRPRLVVLGVKILEDIDDGFLGVAAMDDDGFPQLPGQLDLLAEMLLLQILGRIVLEKIEADFPQGHHLRVGQQGSQFVVGRLVDAFDIMRVHPGRGVDEVVPLRQHPAAVAAFHVAADVENVLNALVPRAAEHFFPVGVELRHVQVGVGIDDHRTRTPLPGSSPKPARTTLLLWLAARTIPCDSTPMSLAGFRLATRMTVWPINCSGS